MDILPHNAVPAAAGTINGVFEYVDAFFPQKRGEYDPGRSSDHDYRVHRHGRACPEPYPKRRGREIAIYSWNPARRKPLCLSPGCACGQQKRHRPCGGGVTESDAVEKQAGSGAAILSGSSSSAAARQAGARALSASVPAGALCSALLSAMSTSLPAPMQGGTL